MNKPGVLLVNLGSPDSPRVPDVRRYLREFLMDGRVLDTPYLIRFLIVHGLILPLRPRRSAEAYEKIWTPEGSPLIATSRKVQQALQARTPIPVELAMRYQNPSIAAGVDHLLAQGVETLLLVPLFPHYAMSSFETAVERVKELLRQRGARISLTVQPPCFDHPDYIEALVASAAADLAQPYDHLLFSFHGLPERHLRKADPTGAHCLRSADCCRTPGPAHATCYRAHCFQTVAAFVQRAGVTAHSVAFQSRLGRDPWLAPYTDHELIRLAQTGVRRLLVICPAFVTDCLETLEEIGLRGRQAFLGAGGTDLRLIPCLNDHPLWIRALEHMVRRFLDRDAASASSGLPAPAAGRV
jgi:protoporphyrin/coproporphyrin ferrochelatase